MSNESNLLELGKYIRCACCCRNLFLKAPKIRNSSAKVWGD
jgi:hypothetical protein